MSRIPDVRHMSPARGDVTWREEPDGTVTVQKRKFGKAAAAMLKAFKVPPTLDVHLDRIGSRVWLLMDGRTVGAILESLQTEFPDEDDLGERLGQYLSTMASNDLIELN